jgi:hypothetical protein
VIISQRHKFIFTAIPKTGTHAVRRALREHMGPEDQEQVGLFVQKRFSVEALAQIGHGHITLAQVRPYLTPEAFDGYFKFAFVRNPFDRFVSFCAFATRQDGAFEADPQGVMRRFLAEPPTQQILFRPQHTFVADANGKLLTDEIGRVEEMQLSYDAICRKLGIPSAQLEKVNSSRRNDYRGYYDQALIDGVAALYQRDLDLFGYTFDGRQ